MLILYIKATRSASHNGACRRAEANEKLAFPLALKRGGLRRAFTYQWTRIGMGLRGWRWFLTLHGPYFAFPGQGTGNLRGWLLRSGK